MRKAFGIAAFAATVAATALALSRAGVQTSGPGWQEKDLASLKTDVEHLRREQRSLEDLTRATAARAEEQQSNRGGGAGTDHEASAPAATQELAPAAANDHPATAPAPTAKEMKEAVEARFFSQERDPVWSKDAVARLSDQLVPRLPQGSRITSLDCLQTMCRVEVVHSSLESHQAFLRDAFMTAPPDARWDGSLMVGLEEESRGGQFVTVGFLAKRDTPLFAGTAGN